MMQRDRKRGGLRECRAAWLVGVTVREYRSFEAGNQVPDVVTWDRIWQAVRVAAEVGT